jgi:DeoR family fructose operon transcriptional repressor
MMLVERRKEILHTILNEGSVKVESLAKKYGVALPTIRRDLKYLAEEYGVEVAYGGAYRKDNILGQNISEMSINQKRMENIDEKKMIAKKAAELINDGETIALNAGSTVELILDYLPEVKKLNIITLSINVAVKASRIQGVNVYMPGGKLRSYSGAFYGEAAENFIKQFRISKSFFGVSGVTIHDGITHGSLDEVATNQILAEISKKCYLMADYSKFGKVALVKMFELNDFDALIVDNKIPKVYCDYAENNDIEII